MEKIPGPIMDHAPEPLPVTMDPESLNAMSRNFWNSAILRAAIKLNIFALLETGASSSAGRSHLDLVQRTGANHRFLHAFLEACVTLGLLELQGGTYRNSRSFRLFDQG